MKLQAGERLPGAGPPSHPGGYVVTGVVTETPWYGLYTAKKILYNFDLAAKRLREADEKEWLDVYLRTINYPRLDDPRYVAERRARARDELRRILGNRTSNLWPEPLDLLEVPNTRDPFTFAAGPVVAPLESGEIPVVGAPVPAPALNPRGTTLLDTEPIIVFARPQGETLARWRQNVLPMSWVLSVLAELLEFVRVAHGDGMLLNGLGPGAVVVDRVGRVHYLASDMVVEMAPGTRLVMGPDLGPAVDWARFFPPERYPRGFAAPECFDAKAPRDRRTDLYGWATIAYFLLTADRPAQLAFNQGQNWARFGEAQFARLEEALRAVPPALMRIWAEQLRVDRDALERGWPLNLLNTVRNCLRVDRLQRPAAIADFRDWLVTPPPPPLAAALAVRVALQGPIRVYLDTRGLDPFLGMVVRRQVGFQPVTADEGDLVAEGPLRPWVEDTGFRTPGTPAGSIFYAVFTRAEHGSRVTYSPATLAVVIEANPTEIRRHAEASASPGSTDEPEPAPVRLLFEAFDRVALANILLDSALPQVRHWAVARMGQGKKVAGAADLLWRALQDPIPSVHLEAARGLLDGASHPPAPLVRQVVEILGVRNTDNCIEAARALRQIGVADEVIDHIVTALEKERPVVCPECGVNLQHRDRSVHLIAAHDYVDVFGTLLPRRDALARLWDRTLSQADAAAHDRLCELLLPGTPPEPIEDRGSKVEDRGVPAAASPSSILHPPSSLLDSRSLASPYVASLEEELLRRADALFAARWQELPRLVQCLRRHLPARPYFRHLLTAADPRVREVGRELVLPDLGERLAGDDISALDVRRELDRLCPAELIDEKIQLCLRLPHVGVDAVASEGCLRALQEERPVVCRECGGTVKLGDLQTHLRRAHKIYLFRGARRSLKDTLATLLAGVCGVSPDYEAWRVLEVIARDEYRAGADSFLAAQLSHSLRAVTDGRRVQAVAAAAQAMVAGGNGPHLTQALAQARLSGNAHATIGHLALELASRLPPPLPANLIAAVRPLLADREVPLEVRLDGAAALLRSTGKAGPAATEVLTALASDAAKAKAIEHLRQLEQRVGNSPAIDELCTALEDQVRMECPRCGLQLQRPAMRKHLWEDHRLILDGRRVREPWRLLEDWLEDYRLEKDIIVLERCRELAHRLDSKNGLFKLYRLILTHGIDHPEARRQVTAAARRQRQSLCPHCYALVPPREESAPAEVSVGPGLLAAPGYRVEVSDGGLVRRLDVEVRGHTLHRGSAPDRWLTRKGALVVLAGLPALAAGVLALLLPSLGIDAPLPVLGALGLALLAAIGVFLIWRPAGDPLNRAVDFAWKMLVPSLHAGGFSAEDSAFAAGLALASAGRGDPKARAGPLAALRDVTQTAVAEGGGWVRHLAALWRLTAEDLAQAGQDAAPLVVGQIGRCFDGSLPLSFAGQMLSEWSAPWWTAGNLNRLRVLLCARAFETGLEVHDLVDIGRVTPTLAAALKTDDLDALGHLRLLWSLRATRPWDRFGSAVTVFDLAADAEAGRAQLARYPDLLFLVREEPAVHVCVRGLAFFDLMFTRAPRTVEVVSRRQSKEDGYDLVLDDKRFRFTTDPDPIARRLERLFRYYFHDLRGQVPAVLRWRSAAAKALRARNAIPCPECRQPVLTRVGNVGVALETPGVLEPVAGKSVG